jgi:5-methylcytosine-specific restriction endonuclease McrBC GTP-binding regulatory subunit McrB
MILPKIKSKKFLMIMSQRQKKRMHSIKILMSNLQTIKLILANIWTASKLLTKLKMRELEKIKAKKSNRLTKVQDAKAWLLSTNMPLNRKNLLRPYSLQIYHQTSKIILSLKKKPCRNLSVCIFFYNKTFFLENQQRIKVYSRKMNNIENAIKNCEINY